MKALAAGFLMVFSIGVLGGTSDSAPASGRTATCRGASYCSKLMDACMADNGTFECNATDPASGGCVSGTCTSP